MRDFTQVDARVDPDTHPRPPASGARPRLDAGDLFHALDLNRTNAGRARPDGQVELAILLRYTAVHDELGRDAARQSHLQLPAAHDVGAAALRGERSNDGPRAVGLDGVGDEVPRRVERSAQIPGRGGDTIQVVHIGRGPGIPGDIDEPYAALPTQEKRPSRIACKRHGSFE